MKNMVMTEIRSQATRQQGYMLLSVMVLVTVMLIALAAELPRISQQIKRDKEEEMIHRGKEYAMAIKRYYHSRVSNGNYPLRLEQLENTNNLRFLRKRFKDPMTVDGEWKLVHFGEADIKVNPGGSPGVPGNPGATGAPGINPFGGSVTPTPTPSVSPSPSPAPSPSGTGNPTGATGPTTSNPPQGAGFIIGVVSNSKATSIREFNDTSEYDQWMFVFDPRGECQQAPGAATPTPGCQGNGIFIAAPRVAGAPPQGPGGNPSPSGSPPSPQPGLTPTPPAVN